MAGLKREARLHANDPAILLSLRELVFLDGCAGAGPRMTIGALGNDEDAAG
jgi:hypothetical protein